jgi:nanoRNase/pAp phosphatase (c-di-AMP/oligoRNAs hydrolase)
MIRALLDYCRKTDRRIYIQTHNFPDHDAVASAAALQYLLDKSGIPSRILYDGEIQRDSLKAMVQALEIRIDHHSRHHLSASDCIIIVDGCKGNKNVTDLPGTEIAVLDHHRVTSPEDVAFQDIRPELGACSTLIFLYLQELAIPISVNIATALMIGINMDTAQLTREVSEADINAHSGLFPLANDRLVNSILRNYIQVKDLAFYRQAIDNLHISQTMGFCYFPEGCNQNLLGILGDFFLALQELDFVVLCARNNDRINVSLRNENPAWNAAEVIRRALSGIGFGGGHKEMAGGIIPDAAGIDREALLTLFRNALYGPPDGASPAP